MEDLSLAPQVCGLHVEEEGEVEKEEEEKREVFLHRIGEDRAEENNAIKILACFNNKNENEEVVYCEFDKGQVDVGQGQGEGEGPGGGGGEGGQSQGDEFKVEIEQSNEEIFRDELGKKERDILFDTIQIGTLDVEGIKDLDCEIPKVSSINCAALTTPVIKCERNVSTDPKIKNVSVIKSENSTLSMMNIPTNPDDKVALDINIVLGGQTLLS